MQYTSKQFMCYNIFKNSTTPLFYAHFIEYTFVYIIIIVAIFTRWIQQFYPTSAQWLYGITLVAQNKKKNIATLILRPLFDENVEFYKIKFLY